MIKTEKYIFAKSENDIHEFLGFNRTPIIKVSKGKIIQPKEIDLEGLTFKEWIIKNPDILTYFTPSFLSQVKPREQRYFNPEWNLYELLLDKNEDFVIFEDIKKENSQFQNDIRQYNILQKNLDNVFNIIEPSKNNKNVFGLELRNIILLSAMEVEVHWQKLLKNNGYEKIKLTTNDYVKLQEFINFNFNFKLNYHPDFGTITPFIGWNAEKPTNSLEWYETYNKIKHDRGTNLNMASLQQAITSVSAVLTLLYIRYGQKNINEKLQTNIFSTTNSYGFRVSKHKLSSLEGLEKETTYIKYFQKI